MNMRTLVAVMALFLCESAWACSADSAEVIGSLDTAASAWADLDLDGFSLGLDEALISLGCMTEPLSTDASVRLHELMALQRFAADDMDRAQESLAALKVLLPERALDAGLVPDGHPLQPIHASLPTEATDESLPAEDGALLFDGRASADRPTGRATVVQALSEDGEIQSSAYLFAADPMPPYRRVAEAPSLAEAPSDPVGPEPLPEPVERSGGSATPLWIASGSAAVVGGVLYGLAASSEASLKGGNWSTAEEARSKASRTNTLFVGSVVAGTAAVGTGLSAAVVATW